MAVETYFKGESLTVLTVKVADAFVVENAGLVIAHVPVLPVVHDTSFRGPPPQLPVTVAPARGDSSAWTITVTVARQSVVVPAAVPSRSPMCIKPIETVFVVVALAPPSSVTVSRTT